MRQTPPKRPDYLLRTIGPMRREQPKQPMRPKTFRIATQWRYTKARSTCAAKVDGHESRYDTIRDLHLEILLTSDYRHNRSPHVLSAKRREFIRSGLKVLTEHKEPRHHAFNNYIADWTRSCCKCAIVLLNAQIQ